MEDTRSSSLHIGLQRLIVCTYRAGRLMDTCSLMFPSEVITPPYVECKKPLVTMQFYLSIEVVIIVMSDINKTNSS